MFSDRKPGAARITRARQQNGVALIVALVMLLIIGLMSASMMRTALTTDVVANNTRSEALAQQAAEVALRYCERQAVDVPSTVLASATPAVWTVFTNWFGATVKATTVDAAVLASTNSSFTATVAPQCMAENAVLEDGVTAVILVTARGFSPDYAQDSTTGQSTSGSAVWLQSTLRFN